MNRADKRLASYSRGTVVDTQFTVAWLSDSDGRFDSFDLMTETIRSDPIRCS